MKVLTVGSFDLYHYGHGFLLEQARKLAGPEGQVIVGVNTSEFIKHFKGQPPVQNDRERIKALLSVKYVDQVIVNNDVSLKSMLAAIRPDILLIGQDWALKSYYGQIGVSQEWLDANEISLLYVPRAAQDISSTELKRRIREHDQSI